MYMKLSKCTHGVHMVFVKVYSLEKSLQLEKLSTYVA